MRKKLVCIEDGIIVVDGIKCCNEIFPVKKGKIYTAIDIIISKKSGNWCFVLEGVPYEKVMQRFIEIDDSDTDTETTNNNEELTLNEKLTEKILTDPLLMN